MRDEYDFSGGVRGKHFQAYRKGHRVRITKEDGTIEEHHFTLEDGAVIIDPDLRAQFPDSDSVNRALRSIAGKG
jgi:hypothetical protein